MALPTHRPPGPGLRRAPDTASTSRPRPVCVGRYELLGKLASGGMGRVFLARHARQSMPSMPSQHGGFERLFAIKLMHEHLRYDEEFLGMFLDEARIASQLHHHNVVSILDVGEDTRGHFLVMDYIEGCTLGQLLRRQPHDRPPELLVPILLDMLNGLQAAHSLHDKAGRSLQLVHRDVSPSNLLIGVDGVARLTDFGVAKARSRITSTQPGVYKGRIAYAAPEQLLAGESTDARADIFAAGVVMWTALTGERLFAGGGDEATVQRLLRMNIPAPSTRLARPPKCLDAVCLKALQRLPGRRYQSAREMAHELREVARAQGLLGDSSEVGDWVQSSFREELAARRAELRGRDDGTQRMRLEREDRIAAVSALPGIGARPVRPPPVPANTQIRPQTPPGPARCPEGPALRSVPPARTATLASFPERATRDHRRTTRRPSELSTSTSEDSAPMSPPWAALSRIQLRGRIWLVCVALAVGALAGGWLSWTALSVPSVTSVPPAPSVTSVPSALSAETNAIPPSAKTYAGTVSAPKRTPDEASSPNARAPAPATPDTAGAADVTQEGTGPALPGRPATTGSDVVPTSDPARSARRQARRVQRAKRRKLAIEARRQGLDDNPYLHTR